MFNYCSTLIIMVVWLVLLQQPPELLGKVHKSLQRNHRYHHHHHHHYSYQNHPKLHNKHYRHKHLHDHRLHLQTPEYELIPSSNAFSSDQSESVEAIHSILNSNTLDGDGVDDKTEMLQMQHVLSTLQTTSKPLDNSNNNNCNTEYKRTTTTATFSSTLPKDHSHHLHKLATTTPLPPSYFTASSTMKMTKVTDSQTNEGQQPDASHKFNRKPFFNTQHTKFSLNALVASSSSSSDYDEQDQEQDADYYYEEYAYSDDNIDDDAPSVSVNDDAAASSAKNAAIAYGINKSEKDTDVENVDNNSNSHFGFINDNNLSDRSYTRITRSRVDQDYVDDEPYHNTINDQMQRDSAPGIITEQKYSEVGNENAVQQARDRYIQENNKRPRTPHELATDHWHRMIVATKCRKPMPRVIPVSNNTSKRYEPYATILHRCGEDTGCCGSTASVCTVKRYEVVMVYVFSYDFNYRKEIEALPMQNHTECHCVNRGSLLMHDSMPRGKRSGQHHQPQQWQQKLLLQQQQQTPEQQLPISTIAHWRRSDILAKSQLQKQQNPMENMLSCHCPQHFNVFEEDVERHAHLPRPHSVFTRKCRCDCLLNNVMCQRFKTGEEAISLEDRRCILEHNCKPPVCLYGDFNSKLGKCPMSTTVSSLQRSEVALN